MVSQYIELLSNGISVILILTYSTAVSFSPACAEEDPSKYCETVHCALPSNVSQ